MEQTKDAGADRYGTFLQAIDAGFCVIEMLWEGDRAVDYRFLEVNPAFERQSGVSGAVGRCVSELLPSVEQFWIDTYGRVARTGEPVRLEHGSAALGRWFDVEAVRVGSPDRPLVALLFTDITERHRNMLARRDSEERLDQALTAGQGVGVWDWDVVHDRVTADPRFAQLYGVDPDRARDGAPIADFFGGVHPADLDRVQREVAQAMATGGTFASEYRLLLADGSMRWVAAQGRCALAEDGTPLRFPGVTFDISARRASQLRDSTLLEIGERIRDLTDPAEIAHAACAVLGAALGVSRVGYGVIDPVAETITIERDWNAPGVTTLAGTLRFRDHGSYIDDLKAGRTVAVADSREDARTRETSATLEAIAARSFINMPLVEHGRFVALFYVNNAGARRWSEDDIVLMREVAERVRAETERVRAEAARRTSDERFRVFAQAVPNQIWSCTADGDFDWFNDRIESFTGRPTETLYGRDGWRAVVHPDDLDTTIARWTRSLRDGSIYENEYRLRGRDGSYRWFLARGLPVHDAQGRTVRWVGTNTDVEDYRAAVAALGRLNETLEAQVAERTRELMVAEEALRQSQKMEAVGQLTGGIAHDFNNLLTGISGSLELMGIRISQGRFADVERYALAAQSAARRAAALTHRLLAFSRRQTLDPRPTDVNRLVTGMEELIRRTVGTSIELEMVSAVGLWTTLIDPNQLENALLNLCINARDAMPDGGRLTVETANRWLDDHAARMRDLTPGQYVSLCVSDTGVGMTPDVIAKAFDPFFTTKPLGQGTGLGLSMIYGFARQSGGQARIYSEPGQGTMVCLYLPRHLGEAEATDAQPGLDPAAHDGSGRIVLVVDDEPTIRMLVIEVLEELGYAALEAGDGAAGLAILQSDARIDLLITDVGLPGGMNGRQMADAARLVRPDLRILFITGYAENAVLGSGLIEQGMHVLTKPFTMEALTSRIETLIEE